MREEEEMYTTTLFLKDSLIVGVWELLPGYIFG